MIERAGMLVAFLALALAPVVPVALPAQQRPSVAGTVYSADGRPLAGVEVNVREGGRRTRSDGAGAWRIELPAAGRYRVTLRRVGFEPARHDVELTAVRPVARLADTLQYTGVRLDAVVVSARRAALPQTFNRAELGVSSVAFAEDIRAIPTNLNDVSALMERSPRLRAMSAFTRGKPPTCDMVRSQLVVQQMVFIDGKLLPPGFTLDGMVGPYELEAFEITRGPAAMHAESRRRAAGDTTGPHLDPRIGGCPWVWLLWTKEYARRHQ